MTQIYVIIFMFVVTAVNASGNDDRFSRYSEPAEDISSGTFPWIARIRSGKFACTASLISDRHLLTSAHCPKVPQANARFHNSVSYFTKKAIRFIDHPGFTQAFNNHDISIIEIEPVEHKIPVPYVDFENACLNKTHLLSAGYSSGTTLRLADFGSVTVCDNEKYVLTYGGVIQRGNSGSPLFFLKNNTAIVLGVGQGSRWVKRPGKATESSSMYVSVHFNKDFINDYLRLTRVYSESKQSYTTYGISLGVGNWTSIAPLSTSSAIGTLNSLYALFFLGSLWLCDF